MISCGRCRWWTPADGNDHDPRSGTCQRFPPQLVVVPRPALSIHGGGGMAVVSSHPQTPVDCFCGEFSAKESVQ